MHYASLGFALRCREEFNESYQYLRKALEMGEEIHSAQVIGYACSQLGWTCSELGLLDEAVEFGERAREICAQGESDYFLFCITLFGLGQAYWYKGEWKKAMEVGKALLEFGKRNSHIRSMVCGHWNLGHSHFIRGDFPSAIECYKQAVEISVDPLYSQIPRTMLGYKPLGLSKWENLGKNKPALPETWMEKSQEETCHRIYDWAEVVSF